MCLKLDWKKLNEYFAEISLQNKFAGLETFYLTR